MMTSVKNVKMSRHIENVFITFLKVFTLFSMCAKFQVNKYWFSIQKKIWWGYFNSNPCKVLRGQNALLRIGLIYITESSDTLNYKPFFKHSILQTILHVLLLFIFVWNKISCSENWAVFLHFLFSLGWHSVLQYKRFYVSGAFFYKFIGN